MRRPRNASGLHAWVELSDADIREMMKEVEPDVDRVLEAAAGRIASEAMASTAFRDGTSKHPHKHLRDTIQVRKSRYDGYIVQATAPHAFLVEYGHAMVTHEGRIVGHVPAHSFLRSAKESVLASLGLGRGEE